MELITRTARLVPYAKRPKQVPSFVSAVVYELTADDPLSRLGSLFIIVEVLVSGRPGEDVGDTIINSFQTAYYDPAQGDNDSLTRFEFATKATNSALGELVNQGNASWIGKLSAVVAVQSDGELHLTHSGSSEAYLYRHGASTRITTSTGSRPTGPAKTFGLVASGLLEAGDHILMATPALVHQISLPKLHDVVSSTSPNTAIAELTELLKGSDASRIAALVIEVTTPELAALQVRTDQPSDVTLGAPDNPLEAAKLMAAPIAQATMATGLRAGRAARSGWDQTRPKIKQVSAMAAEASKSMWTGQRIARRALIGLAVLIVIAGGFVWHQSTTSANDKLLTQYQHDYQNYISATQITDPNSKRAALTAVQNDLISLTPRQTQLNRLLAKATLVSGAPKTSNLLLASVNSALNQLDGLVMVTPTTVANFTAFKGATPSFIEVNAGSVYAVDRANGTIYVVDLATNLVKKASVDTSKVGKVVATTLSSTGDGIYLLTAQPSVWFYKFNGNSLAQLSLGLSGWEPASAISSYAGNLYLLSGSQIEKHVRTSTGFSPGVAYLSGTTTVPNPSSLAVDGFVYLGGSDGLYQYLAGAATTSVPARSGLTNLARLRPTSASQLIGVDSSSSRIGVWSDATTLSFIGQYSLSGIKVLSDAVYDPTSKTYYASADGRIVSFQPSH
ncbi:hypothetical protein HJC99_02505 [Candidatus Saccharibacteria bacterium]|nr:hypothetical protein [Candidatus Saccharibacteria bacterium]